MEVINKHLVWIGSLSDLFFDANMPHCNVDMRSIKFHDMLLSLCRNSGPSYLFTRSSKDWQKWHSIEYGCGNFNWKWGRTCSIAWEVTHAIYYVFLCSWVRIWMLWLNTAVHTCKALASWLSYLQFYMGGRRMLGFWITDSIDREKGNLSTFRNKETNKFDYRRVDKLCHFVFIFSEHSCSVSKK